MRENERETIKNPKVNTAFRFNRLCDTYSETSKSDKPDMPRPERDIPDFDRHDTPYKDLSL